MTNESSNATRTKVSWLFQTTTRSCPSRRDWKFDTEITRVSETQIDTNIGRWLPQTRSCGCAPGVTALFKPGLACSKGQEPSSSNFKSKANKMIINLCRKKKKQKNGPTKQLYRDAAEIELRRWPPTMPSLEWPKKDKRPRAPLTSSKSPPHARSSTLLSESLKIYMYPPWRSFSRASQPRGSDNGSISSTFPALRSCARPQFSSWANFYTNGLGGAPARAVFWHRASIPTGMCCLPVPGGAHSTGCDPRRAFGHESSLI